jgi:hypothetical protein
LFSGFAEQKDGLLTIFGNVSTVRVPHSEIELRRRIILFSGFAKPEDSLLMVSDDAVTVRTRCAETNVRSFVNVGCVGAACKG